MVRIFIIVSSAFLCARAERGRCCHA